METIKTAMEQLKTNSGISPREEFQENSKTEISIYEKGKVSSKCWIDNIFLLKNAFPDLQKGFYDILERLLDDEGFNDLRFTDSVKNLITTYIYPRPTIANILGYDKKIKTYTWDELGKMSADYSPDARQRFWKQYSNIKIGDQTRYVLSEYSKYFPNNEAN